MALVMFLDNCSVVSNILFKLMQYSETGYAYKLTIVETAQIY
jgi:hypothetical protein